MSGGSFLEDLPLMVSCRQTRSPRRSRGAIPMKRRKPCPPASETFDNTGSAFGQEFGKLFVRQFLAALVTEEGKATVHIGAFDDLGEEQHPAVPAFGTRVFAFRRRYGHFGFQQFGYNLCGICLDVAPEGGHRPRPIRCVPACPPMRRSFPRWQSSCPSPFHRPPCLCRWARGFFFSSGYNRVRTAFR